MSQRVKRAKLALLGPVLPLLNPIRVAEELATLDNLCGGRLIAGFLRGIPVEFQTYSVNPAETRELFDESLELILNAWSQPEPFSWEGRHFRYRTVSVWPRPVQQPHPPLYMSGKAPESGVLAARHHMGMCLSFNNVAESLDAIGWYWEQCALNGWEPAPDQILYRGYVYVAETDEQAKREADECGFGQHPNPTPAGRRAGGRAVDGDLSAASVREGESSRSASGTATLERAAVWNGTFFCGSPTTVLEQIRYAREVLGVGIVDLIVANHELPRDRALRSLDLLGTEVLPRIREL